MIHDCCFRMAVIQPKRIIEFVHATNAGQPVGACFTMPAIKLSTGLSRLQQLS